MYRTYSSYKDMPVPANRRTEAVSAEPKEKAQAMQEKNEKKTEQLTEKTHKECENKSLLADLKTDDIILIAIAFVLLTDGCDDKILLAAIAYVFLSEIL